ncbi:prepilin-type N-terminal cleavage/methylation domain-containing protein, partial [Staphylococcus warneri]
MAKQLQIKAYNFIEILMVLFILSILLVCTISSKNLLTISKSN